MPPWRAFSRCIRTGMSVTDWVTRAGSACGSGSDWLIASAILGGGGMRQAICCRPPAVKSAHSAGSWATMNGTESMPSVEAPRFQFKHYHNLTLLSHGMAIRSQSSRGAIIRLSPSASAKSRRDCLCRLGEASGFEFHSSRKPFQEKSKPLPLERKMNFKTFNL